MLEWWFMLEHLTQLSLIARWALSFTWEWGAGFTMFSIFRISLEPGSHQPNFSCMSIVNSTRLLSQTHYNKVVELREIEEEKDPLESCCQFQLSWKLQISWEFPFLDVSRMALFISICFRKIASLLFCFGSGSWIAHSNKTEKGRPMK